MVVWWCNRKVCLFWQWTEWSVCCWCCLCLHLSVQGPLELRNVNKTECLEKLTLCRISDLTVKDESYETTAWTWTLNIPHMPCLRKKKVQKYWSICITLHIYILFFGFFVCLTNHLSTGLFKNIAFPTHSKWTWSVCIFLVRHWWLCFRGSSDPFWCCFLRHLKIYTKNKAKIPKS